MAEIYFTKYIEVKALFYDGTNFAEIKEFGGTNVRLKGSAEETTAPTEDSLPAAVIVRGPTGNEELLPNSWLVKDEGEFRTVAGIRFEPRYSRKVLAGEVVVNEVLVSEHDDPAVHAQAFVDAMQRKPQIAYDVETMTAWFANCVKVVTRLTEFKKLRKTGKDLSGNPLSDAE